MICRYRFAEHINSAFLVELSIALLAGTSPVGQRRISIELNVSTCEAYSSPPPLAEQHRIVARVDELMALCDQLEAQLTATEADSRRLLEAVLHEALNPLAEVTEQWGRLQAGSMPAKLTCYMQSVSNDPCSSFFSIRRAASQDTCQQYSEPVHIVSFSMRVISMSRSMCMWSVNALIPFDCNTAGVNGQRFVGYSVIEDHSQLVEAWNAYFGS